MRRTPHRSLTRFSALALAAALALPALAQGPVDRDTAKRSLFDTRNVQMAITRHAFLTEADIAALQAMPQVAQLRYYGALAANPRQGLQSEATQAAFNFHTPEAARAAALRACGSGCVVVAEIRPRDFAPGRALTLNQDASVAVAGRAFGRAGRDAALAISPSTGAWGLGDGAGAAVATCAALGAGDCAVAVTR